VTVAEMRLDIKLASDLGLPCSNWLSSSSCLENSGPFEYGVEGSLTNLIAELSG